MGNVIVYVAEAMDPDMGGELNHIFLTDEQTHILDENGNKTGDSFYLINGEDIEGELPLHAEFGILGPRGHYGDFFVRRKYRLSSEEFAGLKKEITGLQMKHNQDVNEIQNRRGPAIMELEERVRKATEAMQREIDSLGPMPSIKEKYLQIYWNSQD